MTSAGSFEDAVLEYARRPSRRGFLGLFGRALAVSMGGGALLTVTVTQASAEPDCFWEYPARDLDSCDRKRHHPGHTPTTNGCGPEGGALSAVIPNSWGKADFKPSCDTHDVCYGTCGNSKEDCDLALGLGAADSCKQAYGGGGAINATLLAACTTIAYDYGAAVLLGGQDAFDQAQKEDCECCHLKSVAYCGPLDSCYSSAGACLEECKSGLGVFGENLCGPPPEGKCQ
jgi:hypothetical protein